MKLSILPKKNQQKDDPAKALLISENLSSNSIISFIEQNILYVISFIIPFLIILYIYRTKGIIPYGAISSIAGTSEDGNGISVLIAYIKAVNSRSFSFADTANSSGLSFAEALPLYLGSPFTLCLALFPLEKAFAV